MMEAIRNMVPEALAEKLAGVPMSIQVIGITVLVSLLYSYLTTDRPSSLFPVISVRGKSPLWSWLRHGPEVVEKGLKTTSGPFQVITGTGPRIILPNKYADEIRNSPELNFPKAFIKEFMVNYPGFEPHRQGVANDYLIQDVVRIRLTQSLGLITDDIVDETVFSLNTVLGKSDEWVTRTLKEDCCEIVARVSSRVFLGADLCRNRRWLDISKTYTTDSFLLSRLMRFAPKPLRPLVYLVLPQSWKLRASVRDAHKLITPEVEKRKAKVDEARAAGVKPPKTSDAIGWMYDIASTKGDAFDLVNGQLSLSMAAIHTTTESLGRAMLDLCKFPEVIDMLREEIIEVLGREGWAKTTLYKLKIMDSFLKESQRFTPLSSTSMNRYVEKEMVLSDGTTIPKDSRIVVTGNYMDPEIFEEPEKFDSQRFVKMRQRPGQENSWQFVTTSASHFSFGHGQHACPGRFFAVNELKILLCHMLLKYDWRFVPDEPEPTPLQFEAASALHPKTRLQMRSRTPEIDLDNL